MTRLAAVVLTAAKLEDHHLLGTILRHDLRRHLCTSNSRPTDLRRLSADEQDFLEGDRIPGFAVEFLDTQDLSFADPVLLAARLDDRVHVFRFLRDRASPTWSPRNRERDYTEKSPPRKQI